MPALASERGRGDGATDDARDGALEATDALWQRLARPFPLGETVEALFGLSPDVVAELAATLLCLSDEAEVLLARMPSLVRSLTTASSGTAVRVRGEIRGPVLWSETMSARAASFGDGDLFVCKAPQRDYDTAENQVLVAALRAIAGSGRAIDHAPSRHGDERVHHARANAREARLYLDHPALTRVSTERVRPRTVKRVRGGKAADRYRPALAVLERATEPLGVHELVAFCDRRTRRQHALLLAVFDELERRGMRVPALRVEGGSLLAGPVSYLHPRRPGAAERLHGVLVGEVLIDVPDRLDDPDPDRARRSLAARAGGRTSVVVHDEHDVPAAIDTAVRDARARVAHGTRASG